MKWDNSGAIVYVYDALGRLAAEYTTAAPQNNGISYLTTDHLGSTRVVSGKDGSGNAIVKARYDYLPFGEELGLLGGRTLAMGYSQTHGLRQKFTEKERDIESGLDYFIARYYSSAQGRFTSPDEFAGGPDELWVMGSGDGEKQALVYADVAQPQSLNKYQYCLNNPLRYIDPDGHQTVSKKKKRGGVDNNGELYIKIFAAAPFGLGGIAVSLLLDPPSVYAPSEGEEFERPTAQDLIKSEGRAMAIGLVIPGLGKLKGNALSRELGKAGEEAVEKYIGGGISKSFDTSLGRRVVDRVLKVDGHFVAHEAKVGYQSFGKDIRAEVAKDIELLANGTVKEITWHFYKNPASGGGYGASKPLLDALEQAGIKTVFH
jgi:RHS repeat-associated protein